MSGSADPDPHLDPAEADRLEQEHFQKVIGAFKYYKGHALARVARALKSYRKLPQDHQDLIPTFLTKISGFKEAISTNALLIEKICEYGDFPQGEGGQPNTDRPAEFDMDKVYTTLKQFVRDWAPEGAPEREQCYVPILKQLQKLYPDRTQNEFSVLIPGAGLGRLTWDIAKLGFKSQGNEWSLYMLLASNFILNGSPGTHHTYLYPWAHLFCNNYQAQDQLRAVALPDVDTHSLAPGSDFSMTAGDFLEVYQGEGEWDCVATCFFIDTARNIITYLKRIYHILKPGGHWINLGPLLYHFDDNREAPSLELSFDEVRHIITSIGFEITEEHYPHPSGYITHPDSMMKMEYKCVFFTAKKPV